MKVFLSHIFCNKKLVVVTMLNFLFEVGHEVRVYRSSASVTMSFRILLWENVLFEGKNTGEVCLTRSDDLSPISLQGG